MIMDRMPDIESLRSFVHASPTYHAAYRGARQGIFHSITVTSLKKCGIGMLDPWTVVTTPHIYLDTPNRDSIISDTLHYFSMQMTRDIDTRRLEVDEALQILRLHSKIACIAEEYCRMIISHNPLYGEPEEPSPASMPELHRIYRALYRYELYGRLFSRGVKITEFPLRMYITVYNEDDVRRMFFSLFPIHEIEEMACIHKFATDMCDQKKVPRGLTCLGPVYLHDSMKASTKSEADQVWQFCPPHNQVTFRHVIDSYERTVDIGQWNWKGMDMKASEERVTTTGWIWASKNGIQNVDFKLRRWGYVFWDEERLVNWKINEDNMLNFPYDLPSSIGRAI